MVLIEMSQAEFPRDREKEKLIIETCTDAIRTSKKMEMLTQLSELPSREWCSSLNIFGYTLLQESIKHYNTTAFDFLLKFQDLVSLEKCDVHGKNALMLAVDVNRQRQTPEQLQSLEYFAMELINFGAYIHGVYKNETLLDKVLALSFINVGKLLLEKGINVNFEDDSGNTSLHKILSNNLENIDELVPLLLAYGADPSIENIDGFIPFEYAVKYNHTSIQEILFNYTFDEYTACEIHAGILFKLAQNNQFFSKLFHNNKLNFVIKNVHSMRELIDNFDDFFIMDVEHFRIFINKHSDVIKDLISKIFTCDELWRLDFLVNIIMEKNCLTSGSSIQYLNILLDSNIKYHIMELLLVTTPQIFKKIITSNNETDACQLLTFYLSYGLTFTKKAYDEVYLQYGYCELFKLMLLIGSRRSKVEMKSPMCRLICDINFDLRKVLFSMCNNFVDYKNLMVVMDYFTDERLTKILLDLVEKQIEDNAVEMLTRIALQPTVPSLVELSRNVSRKYIIDKFKIKNESRFYSIVKRLPISKTHEKIITYETKLYNL